METQEIFFIEKVTIPKKIKEMIRLMNRYNRNNLNLEKLEKSAIALYYELNIEDFRRFSARVLAGGLIYCAGINVRTKVRLQEISDLSPCADVSIMNVRKKILENLKFH